MKRTPLARGRRAPPAPGQAGFTARVLELYGPCCMACPGEAPHRAVHAHHVIARQRIARARHLSSEERVLYAYDAANGLPICQRAHERHELAVARIARALLTPAHIDWAYAHGFATTIDDPRLYP